MVDVVCLVDIEDECCYVEDEWGCGLKSFLVVRIEMRSCCWG